MTIYRKDMMRDPLRHLQDAHRKHGTDSENLYGDSFMERLAEKTANGMGTVAFVIGGSIIILTWMMVNHLTHFLSHSYHGLLNGEGFDPAPFILLNLVFSGVAFYSASLVIIAQKAEGKKNAAREEAEAKHREEIATEQIKLLNANTTLTEMVHTLTEEVHAKVLKTPNPRKEPL